MRGGRESPRQRSNATPSRHRPVFFNQPSSRARLMRSLAEDRAIFKYCATATTVTGLFTSPGGGGDAASVRTASTVSRSRTEARRVGSRRRVQFEVRLLAERSADAFHVLGRFEAKDSRRVLIISEGPNASRQEGRRPRLPDLVGDVFSGLGVSDRHVPGEFML